MKLLIARVEWMKHYAGVEDLRNPIGGWGQRGQALGEAYNFFCSSDGNYYGYWRVGEKRKTGDPAEMTFSQWADVGNDCATGVSVIFIAKSPDTKDNVVVGFYTDAKILRLGEIRPDRTGRYRAVAAASNGFIIPEEDRIFSYRYRSKSGWFTYGKPDEADDVALLAYINSVIEESQPAAIAGAKEGRRSRWAERIERFQSPWLRSLVIKSDQDLVCAACGLTHGARDNDWLKRRFEVHHLELVSKIPPGQSRVVNATDLAVLCACCHRVVHAADGGAYISNIPALRKLVLGKQ